LLIRWEVRTVRRIPSLSIGKIQQDELVQAPIEASAGSEVLVIIVCNQSPRGRPQPPRPGPPQPAASRGL